MADLCVVFIGFVIVAVDYAPFLSFSLLVFWRLGLVCFRGVDPNTLVSFGFPIWGVV